jgi:hypothetical protein
MWPYLIQEMLNMDTKKLERFNTKTCLISVSVGSTCSKAPRNLCKKRESKAEVQRIRNFDLFLIHNLLIT